MGVQIGEAKSDIGTQGGLLLNASGCSLLNTFQYSFTPPISPFLHCLLHTTFNFLPSLILAGKGLFNLHCSRLTSSYRYI